MDTARVTFHATVITINVVYIGSYVLSGDVRAAVGLRSCGTAYLLWSGWSKTKIIEDT